MLDITPNAVEHLNYAQYFPICVYLKAESHGQVKELRQKYAKNLKAKSSKRLFEGALKLAGQYSHLFTATIDLDSANWFKRLKEVVETQQKQPLWIPDDMTESSASPNGNSFDFGLQQQNFVAKQSLLLQQAEPFDDNFELPIYALSAGGISAAASTYSLYEDQNYRASFASESDACTSNSQQILNEVNQPAPIYSTNFQSRSHSLFLTAQNELKQVETESSPVDTQQQHLNRVLSDPNLTSLSKQTLQNEAELSNERSKQQNPYFPRRSRSPETSSYQTGAHSHNETVSLLLS